MGTAILVLTLLAGDPGRMVSGYFRAPAPTQLENAEQFPAPEVLLALPLGAESNYPIMLDLDELQALYASSRQPGLLYEIARRYQSAGDDAEAEAYFRAFLSRAPQNDVYRDAAFNAVVEYGGRRQVEAEARVRERAREVVPAEMAVMLGAMGWGW